MISRQLVRKSIALSAWLVLLLGGWATGIRGADDKAPYRIEPVEGLDTKEQLFAVRAIDPKSSCIIVGAKGFMARSTDAGRKWEEVKSRTTATLRDVRFVTPQIGLAVGHGGDYEVPVVKPEDLLDLRKRAKAGSHLVNNKACYSTVLRTDNGGKTWVRSQAPTNLNLYRVLWLGPRRAVAISGYFGDPTEQVAVGEKTDSIAIGGKSDGSILCTEDGGKSWKLLYNICSACRAIALTSDFSGWVVGPTGEKFPNIFFGNRRIETIKDLTPQEQRFLGADFVRSVKVPPVWNATSVNLAVFNRERVNADSATFNETGGVGKAPILWDVCIQGNKAWVVGDDGLVVTVERKGKKWQDWQAVELPGEKATLRAIVFRDAKVGMIVGEKGSCFSTMDAGKTWQRVETKTEVALNSIQFMGTTALVVGENGTALRLVPPSIGDQPSK